jgi:hypothetical protein
MQVTDTVGWVFDDLPRFPTGVPTRLDDKGKELLF